MNFDEMFQKGSPVDKPAGHPRRETKWLHYTKLKDNGKQYRKGSQEEIVDLARLIEASGAVLQNVLVRKTGPDEYEIIAGHHRRKACQYLVETEGKKEYEFIPCTIESVSDAQAEFQLYSSNGHLAKTDYDTMHELERMKWLLEAYPEEFPDLKGGRMVERLARQMQMKRTTVGEYLTIAKNLGSEAMEAFKDGSLKKSAAVEMAALPHAEQKKLIQGRVTGRKEIREYKEKRQQEEPDDAPLPGQMRVSDYEGMAPEAIAEGKAETAEAHEDACRSSAIRSSEQAVGRKINALAELYQAGSWEQIKITAEEIASACTGIIMLERNYHR